VSPWENSNKERIGQAVNWQVICSSMGAPGGQVRSWIRYGHGVDKTQEVLMLAQDLGMILKSTAWFTCTFMLECKDLIKEINLDLNTDDDEAILKAFKFQGQDRLYNFLHENPKLVDMLEQKIKAML